MSDPRRWRTLALLGTAQFMLILDVTVVAIALPQIGTDLGLARGHPDLGGQRLHADVRRPDAARWPRRRPVRQPPGGADGACRLHPGLAGDRPGRERRTADRRPDRPRHRGRDPLAGRAVGGHEDLPRRRAQQGARDLVRPGRWWRRGRRTARWCADRRSGLAVGVLRERPDRRARPRRTQPLLPARPSRDERGPTRRTRRAAGYCRYRGGDLRTDQRRRPRLALGSHTRNRLAQPSSCTPPSPGCSAPSAPR